MQKVVSFYERLPRGPAPEAKPRGLLQRYQARYFGKKPSAMRTPPPFSKPRRSHCTILTTPARSSCSRHWRSHPHRLRPELLLPPASVLAPADPCPDQQLMSFQVTTR